MGFQQCALQCEVGAGRKAGAGVFPVQEWRKVILPLFKVSPDVSVFVDLVESNGWSRRIGLKLDSA